jgi:cell division protein FtsZ
VHTLPTPPMRPAAGQEEPRRRFGLFGMRRDKKHEAIRTEPQISATHPVESRATVQVMARNAPPQRATNAPQANADDLFPDFKKEDQFEIPAFLRRQTN